MEMQFHTAGSRAPCADSHGHMLDIVLRLDDAGFVVHASPNAVQLGIDLSSLLLMPHICDFAAEDYGDEIASVLARTKAGEGPGRWIEFPLVPPAGHDDSSQAAGTVTRRWHALWLEPVEDDDGSAQGCIAILRSAQDKYALADEIEALSATDPHTGLANRAAFCGSLARLLARDADKAQHALAVFAVDRMRALFMQYGQQTTDEIRWGFARFLETMTQEGQELAILDEERFAVLLPGMAVRDARDWARDVLHTFGGLTSDAKGRAPELTASAGLARIENSVDWTLRQAEMGLVMARAAGGMKASICGPTPGIANGVQVERAIQDALRRAEQRGIGRSAN